MSLQRQRQRAIEKGMQELAEHVERELRGFTGIVRTPFVIAIAIDGRQQVISNMAQETRAAMLQELLDHWATHAAAPDVPEHEKH